MGKDLEIPIQNIYALLAYAWDHLDLADEESAGGAVQDSPVELLARLLLNALRRLLRRGAHREYLAVAEDLRAPRGRVEVGRTVSRGLRLRGTLSCVFDELLYDVPVNRVLKATARRLLRCRNLPEALATPLRNAYLLMSDVADVQLDDETLRRAHAPRGQGVYRFALDVCRLVHYNLLPEEGSGGYRLRDFTRDDRQMAALFEAFVRNFLRGALPGARVSRPQIAWAGASGSDASLAWLPRMETDLSIEVGDATTIVETKFYRTPFQRRFGGETDRVRSAHLYQLFAYLKNLQGRCSKLSGVLLYASVGKDVDVSFRLDGVDIAVRTLDLMTPWTELRRAMLRLPLAHSTE